MKTTLTLLAIAALALAGVPSTAAKTRTEVVYLHEPFHVAPEQINASVGDVLKVTVINQGQSRHNLVFCGDGTKASSLCDNKWAFTPNLDAGANAQLTVNLTGKTAGTYDYYCDIPGHKAGGMKGVLTLTGSAAKSEKGFLPGFDAALLLPLAFLLPIVRRRVEPK